MAVTELAAADRGRASEGSGMVGIVGGGGEHAGLDGRVRAEWKRSSAGSAVWVRKACSAARSMWTTPRTARRWTRSWWSWKACSSDLAPQAGQVAMVSTVTGTRCEGASLDGAYWCRNLRQTVRLDLALAELIGDGHSRVRGGERASGAGDAAVGGERRAWRGGGIAAPRWRRDAGAAAQSRRTSRSWRWC